MRALRKFEFESKRPFIVIQGRKAARNEVRLPLTIQMFASCIAAGMLFAFFQAAGDGDATTRAILGVLVSLVSALAWLVYRDVVRRMKENEDATKSVKAALDERTIHLEHKLDKAIRAFTGVLVATHPDKASEIYRVSEAFFKED